MCPLKRKIPLNWNENEENVLQSSLVTTSPCRWEGLEVTEEESYANDSKVLNESFRQLQDSVTPCLVIRYKPSSLRSPRIPCGFLP